MALALAGPLPLASCDKSTDQASSDEASAVVSPTQSGKEQSRPASPIETVEQVRRLRGAAQFEELERFIVESQSRHVINLIQSVDRLAHANRVLQRKVIQHYGSASAKRFDRSEITNALGVFSRDVKAVSERITGHRATVTYQVANRLPLQQVELIQNNGRWLIETDAPIPEIAEELRRLADVLSWAARRLDRQSVSADQLDEELRTRQAAIGRRLAELTDSTP